MSPRRCAVFHTFVVIKSSFRGIPQLAIPRPTFSSFLYTEAVSIRRYPDSTAEIIAFSASFSPVALYTPSPSKGISLFVFRKTVLSKTIPPIPIYTLGKLLCPIIWSKYNIKMCQKYIKIIKFLQEYIVNNIT